MFRCPVHPSTPRSCAGTRLSWCSPRRSARWPRSPRELGLNREALRLWVKAEREARAAGASRSRPAGGGQLGTDEREELKRLRKQVAELQLEKEILRKAAQYFAKEMGR
jgi:transposase